MRLLKSLATAVTVTVLASCAKENVPTTTVRQTVEMKNFREAVSSLQGENVSLFNSKQPAVLAQAKALLLAEGYTEQEISNMNSNMIIANALKTYAHKIQSQNNKNN